jgi:uncharacterized protein (DUF169 family)
VKFVLKPKEMEQTKQAQPYNMTMTFCRGMATKKCAREECGKTVYPLEELNCLDKVGFG